MNRSNFRLFSCCGHFELSYLSALTSYNTQITDEGLNEVAKLQNLNQLYLTGVKVTKAGVAELKKVLPKYRIFGP